MQKKRISKILAVVLSFSMLATSVTPVYAEELEEMVLIDEEDLEDNEETAAEEISAEESADDELTVEGIQIVDSASVEEVEGFVIEDSVVEAELCAAAPDESSITVIQNTPATYGSGADAEFSISAWKVDGLITDSRPARIEGLDNGICLASQRISVTNGEGYFNVRVPETVKAGSYDAVLNIDDMFTVPMTIIVEPRVARIGWFGKNSFIYNGQNHGVTAYVTNSLEHDVFNIIYAEENGFTNSKRDVGDYTARVLDLGNPNYKLPTDASALSSLTQRWSIVPQNMNFTEAVVELGDELVYNGQLQTQIIKSVSVDGQMLTEGENGDYIVTDNAAVEPGIHYMYLVGTGNNYKGTVRVEFEIKKRTQKAITIENKPTKQLVYGDAPFTLGAQSDPECTGSLKWEIIEGNCASIDDGGKVTIHGVGTATVKVSKGSDYFNTVSDTWTFTVAKKDITVRANDYEVVYGEVLDGNGYTVEGMLEGDSFYGNPVPVYTYDYSLYEDIPNEERSISVLLVKNENDNTAYTDYRYNISYEPGIITVTKRALAVKWYNDGERIYDNGDTIVEASLDGTVNGDEAYIELLLEGHNAVDAGSYTAKASIAKKPGTDKKTYLNYKLVQNKQTVQKAETQYTIQKRDIGDATIILGDQLQYTGSSQQQTLSNVIVNGVELSSNGDYRVKDHSDIATDAGTYTLVIEGTGNYTGTKSQSFTVLPADPDAIIITGLPGSVTYGDPDFILSTYGGSGEGAVTWKVTKGTAVSVDAQTGKVTVKSAGTCEIMAIKAADDNYTKEVSATAQIIVNKKPVTIKAENATITYGDEPKNAGVTYNTLVEADKNKPDVFTGTLLFKYGSAGNSYTRYGDVGTYPILPYGLSSANYEISYQAGYLTVEQKEIDITWGNYQNRVYRDEKGAVTVSLNGLVNNDNVAAVTENISKTDAGTYTAAVSSLKGDKAGNYKFSDSAVKSLQWTIAPRDITKGQVVLDGDLTYNGSKQTQKIESVSVDGITLKTTDYEVSDNNAVNAGTYKLSVKGIRNFTGTIEKEFSIAKRDQNDIFIAGKKDIVTYGDAPFVLKAVGGSGTGSVKWEVSLGSSVNVSEAGVVTVIGNGPAAITVTKAADANHTNPVSDTYAFNVNKNAHTPNLPDNYMKVPYLTDTAAKVSLPKDWNWSNSGAALTEGAITIVDAVYTGSDSGNYLTEVVSIKIDRAACEHPTKVVKDQKTPSVDAAGYTGDTYCSVCNRLLVKGEVLPKLDAPVTADEKEGNGVLLNLGIEAYWNANRILIKWGKVANADGYVVISDKCGDDLDMDDIVAELDKSYESYSFATKAGVKLEPKREYKIQVFSYRMVEGKRVYNGKSMVMHIAGKNSKKNTNVKKITSKKKTYSVKAGKSIKLKMKAVKMSSKKKLLSSIHGKKIRYITTDKNVATVNSKGKVKAVGTGSCYIYAIALNGRRSKIKINVK